MITCHRPVVYRYDCVIICKIESISDRYCIEPFSSKNILAPFATPLEGGMNGRLNCGYMDSFLKWMVTIPLLLLAWAFLEWSGEKFLGFEFWKRMSSVARVLLLVALIVLIVVVWVVGANWFKR